MSRSVHLFDRSTVRRAARGAAAGLFATAPMTVVMKLLHHQLPTDERTPLPPQKITSRLARTSGLETMSPHRITGRWEMKTYGSHFAYGALCGMIFACLEPSRDRRAIRQGVFFALAVWAISYLGWLPAVGLHRSAKDEPAGRNATMLIAHVVWGTAMSWLYRQMRRVS